MPRQDSIASALQQHYAINDSTKEPAAMAQLVVRNLDEDVKAKLRRRAAAHGCSMEEEVRAIIRDAVREPERPAGGLGSEIAALFKGIGLEQDIPELRGHRAKPAKFD